MKHEVLIGQTDYTVLVKMRDDAGAPATALAHTDIDIAYARVETDNDVTTTDVAPADLANLTAAHSDWGWEVVSATDHPGLYRLDIADAVFASGAWSAVVTISGTGLDPSDLEFVMVPNPPLTGVLLAPTTHTSAVIPTVTTTGTATAVTTVNGLAANVITATSIANDAITDAKVASDVTIASVTGAVGSVTGAVGSVTGAVGSVGAGGITAASIGSGAFTASKFHADTGLVPVATGTAQAGAAGSIQLASALTFADDILIGAAVYIQSGTGAGQTRYISDYTSATDTATITPNWTTAPDNTSVYVVYASGIVSVPTATQIATAMFTVDTGETEADAVAGSVVYEIVQNTGGGGGGDATEAKQDTIIGLIGTPVVTLAADIAVIEGQTDDIGAAGAGLTALASAANLATVAGYLDTEIASLTTELAKVPKSDSNVVWNATAAAQIQTEATDALNAYDPPTRTEATADKDEILSDTGAIAAGVDAVLALLDDAQAEPGQGAPAANADVVTKLAYLYKWARNKKENDGTQNLYYNDDGTTVGQKQATTESAGTVTVGEMATGA